MLLAERAAPARRAVPAASFNWEFFVDCFRLSLPASSSGVSATVTYYFSFEAYDRAMISDHSGKYYAAYFRAGLNPRQEVIQIWDIETGKVIQRINGPFFHESPGVKFTDIMVVAKQGPPRTTAGGDFRKQSFEWLRRWSSRTELKVFPIGDGPPGWDGYVKQAQRCRPSIFKLPRSPAGIAVADDPSTLEYESEKIGLAFWEMDSSSRFAISTYHKLTPDEHAGASRVPLTADGECRIYYKTREGQAPLPFVVQRRSGLSLTLNHLSRVSRAPWRPRSYKYVTLRSFYPSATPGLMELEWKSHIRSWDDGKQLGNYFVCPGERPPFEDICGDEFATAFLQSQERRLYVVLAVWDEPFQEM